MDFDIYAMNSVAQSLRGVALSDLHYAYGVNCYQHARGYPHIIVAKVMHDERPENKLTLMAYMALHPGFDQTSLRLKAKTLQDMRQLVRKGCVEDALIPIGAKPQHWKGFKTLALYVRPDVENFDFHFAEVHKNGSCTDKVPFKWERHFLSVPDKIDSYVFDQYFMAPLEVRNVYLEQQKLKVVEEIVGGKKLSFAFLESASNISVQNFMHIEKLDATFSLDPHYMLPMPAMPAFRTERQHVAVLHDPKTILDMSMAAEAARSSLRLKVA